MTSDFQYYWRVRTRYEERFGQRCKVLVRGKMNSCLVEFPDGFKTVTSRNYVRRRKMIETTGEKIEIRFSEFQSAASYDLFKKVKALPESSLVYDYETDVYTVSTHARYSNILGISEKKAAAPNLAFSEFLFEHQQEITRLAINAKRFAVWADCFTPEALVKADGKYRRISECELGMSIETLKGEAEIERIISKPYSGEIVQIKTASGFFPLRVTPNHKFYVLRKSRCTVPARHNTLCSPLCEKRCNTRPHKNYKIEIIRADQLTLDDCLLFRQPLESIKFQPNEKTLAYLRLAGYWLAEGWFVKESGKIYGLGFGFCVDEESTLIVDVLADLKTLGVKGWIDREKTDRNVLTVRCKNIELAEKIYEDFGEYSHLKKMPRWFFYLQPHAQIVLLTALFKGDAQIRTTPHKNKRLSENIKFGTVSYALASSVRDALLGLGIRCSATVEAAKIDKQGQAHKEVYRIQIPRRFMSRFGFDISVKRRDIKQVEHSESGETYTLIPIRKIQKDSYSGEVWNLTSSGHDSYLTDAGTSKNCGLGKTLIEAEFARQANHITGGRSLILTLPEVALQTIDEVNKFHGKNLPICFLESKQDLRRFCEKGDNIYRLAITNYEKMNPEGEGELQIIREMKNLAALILDENRLKGGGGKQKWAIIKSSKGIPFKLTATATPAPNDYIEFASQASFLERMRNENEIIWTFFAKDKITGEWTVKRHAQEAFFEWMSAWSIYVRNPRNYGWSFDVELPPEPEIIRHEIQITEQQANASLIFNIDTKGQASLFATQSQGVVGRSKMSQIAKGFVYNKDKSITRIESLKPSFVAKLIKQESLEHQVLVWTVFDEESEILNEQLKRFGIDIHQILTGKTPHEKRAEILNDYRTGKLRVLISNSKLLGYGMNLQMTGSMIFSGWNDSFEEWYQTIRRAVRFGNLKRVRIHIPYIPELELAQLETIFKKEAKFIEGIEAQERAYIKAMRRMKFL